MIAKVGLVKKELLMLGQGVALLEAATAVRAVVSSAWAVVRRASGEAVPVQMTFCWQDQSAAVAAMVASSGGLKVVAGTVATKATAGVGWAAARGGVRTAQ